MNETLILTAVVGFAVGFVGGRVMRTRALARRIAEVEARVSVSREGSADYVKRRVREVSGDGCGAPAPLPTGGAA